MSFSSSQLKKSPKWPSALGKKCFQRLAYNRQKQHSLSAFKMAKSVNKSTLPNLQLYVELA